MSMPNIPDITPEINICREDVITLLLASVAMEEMGLAHILNAESEKIQYALQQKECGKLSVEELKELNKNVQQMVDAISRLQMLLQMKMENIMSFTKTRTHTTCSTTCTHTTTVCPTTTRTTTACPTSTRTSTTHTSCTHTKTRTTCSTTCTRSYTTTCRRPCAITGQAEGLISTPDGAVQGSASVECRVALSNSNGGNFLRYTARPALGCGNNTLHLQAMPRTLSVEHTCPLRPCPTEERPNQFIVKGQGFFSDNFIPASVSQVLVAFTLWVVDYGSRQSFRMKFHSQNYNIFHDSHEVAAPANSFTIRCPG